jgi:uncharacterized protein (DUF58 family)
MRKLFLALTALLLLSVCAMAGVSAQTPSDAAAQVTVTSVTLDPGVFMEDDIGTVTVEITNNGAESVPIRRVTMYDTDIRILSSSYDTSMYLGAGNSMTFVFTRRGWHRGSITPRSRWITAMPGISATRWNSGYRTIP